MPEKSDWERLSRALDLEQLEMEWDGSWFGSKWVKLTGRKRGRDVSLLQRWEMGSEIGARTVETKLVPPLDLGMLVGRAAVAEPSIVIDGYSAVADEIERVHALFTPRLRARIAPLADPTQLSFNDAEVHVARIATGENTHEIKGDFDLALDVAEAIDEARARLPCARALYAHEGVLLDLAAGHGLHIDRAPLLAEGEIDGVQIWIGWQRRTRDTFPARIAASLARIDLDAHRREAMTNALTDAGHVRLQGGWLLLDRHELHAAHIEPLLQRVTAVVRAARPTATEGPYR